MRNTNSKISRTRIKAKFFFICIALIFIVVTLQPGESHAELLGRPTNDSVTVNAVMDTAVDYFFEYGTTSGALAQQLPATGYATSATGEPIEVTIDGLAANTRYYYRIVFRQTGTTEWHERDEHSFHTQRLPGSTFRFLVHSDSHILGNAFVGEKDRFNNTLANELADGADFLFDLGDTFWGDMAESEQDAFNSHLFMRSFFDQVGHSLPLFFAPGNHEGESGWILGEGGNNYAIWSTNARKYYYPNPIPDDFYTGSTVVHEFIDGNGLRENYYAMEWGNALFVVIDPYWYCKNNFPPADIWNWSLGQNQYEWLVETLRESNATFKFVFSHQVISSEPAVGRGGIEFMAGEWAADPAHFATKRPNWNYDISIHDLMVENGVSIFFHGHDHLFALEELDGVYYQEVPTPSTINIPDISNYPDAIFTESSGGHLRVTVSPQEVTVEYVRSFLPGESGINGEISYSYTIKGNNNDSDGDGIADNLDNCPTVINPDQSDTDDDGTGNFCDGCPDDPDKTESGVCGCGSSDADADNDGTADCQDGCPYDPDKTEPGVCGCGLSDADADNDGTADCQDGCPNDPYKTAPGLCNCGLSDADGDTDGVPDCTDNCLVNENVDQVNSDSDTFGDVCDNCIDVTNQAQTDTDGDGFGDACDLCRNDAKNDADGDGLCADEDNCPEAANADQLDSDNDTIGDACDECPDDAQNDADNDGVCGNADGCPYDPNKTAPGICGCGDEDTDHDGVCNSRDQCPDDPGKSRPGICGCGKVDTDSDGDGICENADNCPAVANPTQLDSDMDGLGNVCDDCPDDPRNDADKDGICGDMDNCPATANADQEDSDNDGKGNACDACSDDMDNDGVCGPEDGCPDDPYKSEPGACGCGQIEADPDADSICTDVDNCPAVSNTDQTDSDSDGAGNACDACPLDAENDADNDGICGNEDGCPDDPAKTVPGNTGCGFPENYIFPGMNQEVTPCDGVNLLFEEITAGGVTSCTDAQESSPPAKFRFLGRIYDIYFTGALNGPVIVCFEYDETALQGNEESIALLHRSEGEFWQEITTAVDTENNRICGAITSFSQFAIAEPQAVSDTGGGGGGCFIATAAYGSYWEPHVMTLRQFRDEHLLTNKPGTKFVEAYYKYSPPLADIIAENDELRSVVRVGLAPLVGFGWLATNFGVMSAFVVLGGITIFFICGIYLLLRPQRTKRFVEKVFS